jgi:hypothetical protein
MNINGTKVKFKDIYNNSEVYYYSGGQKLIGSKTIYKLWCRICEFFLRFVWICRCYLFLYYRKKYLKHPTRREKFLLKYINTMIDIMTKEKKALKQTKQE